MGGILFEALESGYARGKISPTHPKYFESVFGDRGIVSATAVKERALKTSIAADLGEYSAYKRAIHTRGEIGLERPFNVNQSGRSDFITAARDKNGRMWILANDAKTRSKPIFPKPKIGIKSKWWSHIEAAASNVSLGDKKLEAEIKNAFKEGRVRLRQLNVHRANTESGKPTISNWGDYYPAHQKLKTTSISTQSLPAKPRVASFGQKSGAAHKGMSNMGARGTGSKGIKLRRTGGGIPKGRRLYGQSATRLRPGGQIIPRISRAALGKGISAARAGGAALRGALIMTSRAAYSVSRSFILAFRLMGGWLFVVDFYITIILMEAELEKNRTLRKQFERYMRKELPNELEKIWKKREIFIVDHFISQWNNPKKMFVYWSPLLEVWQLETKGTDFNFAFAFKKIGSLFDFAITEKIIPTYYQDFHDITGLHFRIRISLPFPLLTPFDGLHAYIWELGNRVKENWEAHSRDSSKPGLTQKDNDDFTWIVLLLSQAMTALFMESLAGHDMDTLKFVPAEAVVERKRIIHSMSEFKKKLKAPVMRLMSKGLLSLASTVSTLGWIIEEDEPLELSYGSGGMYGLQLPFNEAIHSLTELYRLPDSVLGYQRPLGNINFRMLPIIIYNTRISHLNEVFNDITDLVQDLLPEWVYQHGIAKYGSSWDFIDPKTGSGPQNVHGSFFGQLP